MYFALTATCTRRGAQLANKTADRNTVFWIVARASDVNKTIFFMKGIQKVWPHLGHTRRGLGRFVDEFFGKVLTLITSDQRKLMAWTQLLLFLGRPSRVLVLR